MPTGQKAPKLEAKRISEKKKLVSESDSKPVKSYPLLPELNIGMVGHVDHGKTTLTEALTGKWTDTHSEEIKRGITIRIGYADATFYKCSKCSGIKAYGTSPKCLYCFSDCKPLRTVSFVDAPGHETLMTTVISGTSIMDGALLVISAAEPCPQPQTREHLLALQTADIKNIVIVQNKIDLVDEAKAIENYRQIKEFVKGSIAEDAPIIPVSAQHKIGLGALIKAIEERIPTPKRDPDKPPKMYVARSFDINKPGTPIEKLKGGILGGSLVQGKLKIGDEIEIRPGIKTDKGYTPIKTRIIGLQKAMQDLDEAGPGGLLGIATMLDPYLTKSDGLAGNVVGLCGKLPPVITNIKFRPHLLERVVGTKEELKIEPLRLGEPLMLTAGITRTVGIVNKLGDIVEADLKLPICAEKGDRVVLARQILGRWRLVGWGEIC
ncbi:MAG: translation initiation factor IF-2 subunit gamma [Candidatus Aenigmatarchaeota archaeon]